MADPVGDFLRDFIHARDFLHRYPYYAGILARMTPFHDPTVRVMAVSTNGRGFHLHINTDYFLAQPRFLRGILLHEVHHVVLGHLSRPVFRDSAHPDLMEIAMEISANEYIEEPLPVGAITWRSYERFGARSNQSTLERYERLARARAEGLPVGATPAVWVDDHAPFGGYGVRAGDREATPAPRDVLVRLIESATEEVGRTGLLAGRAPGKLLEELHNSSGPPTRHVDWRRALQIFVGAMRRPVHTYARPSRRFPDRAGEIPGRAWSPESGNRPELLVAIDTSGSMSAQELQEIGRQLRLLQGLVRITVAECDVEITRTYRFDGALTDVVGRGGTDLRPVFEAGFLRSIRPDGVVYFTDGMGPYPVRDPGIATLWVLTKREVGAFPWGKTVAWS